MYLSHCLSFPPSVGFRRQLLIEYTVLAARRPSCDCGRAHTRVQIVFDSLDKRAVLSQLEYASDGLIRPCAYNLLMSMPESNVKQFPAVCIAQQLTYWDAVSRVVCSVCKRPGTDTPASSATVAVSVGVLGTA